MPTLFRFLVIVGSLAGLGYAAIYALANFTQPTAREMSVTIPHERLIKNR